jgi:hypothetical protein
VLEKDFILVLEKNVRREIAREKSEFSFPRNILRKPLWIVCCPFPDTFEIVTSLEFTPNSMRAWFNLLAAMPAPPSIEFDK